MNKRAPTCSFDEFWKAWGKGKLMTMFNKCWPDLPTESPLMLAEYNLLTCLRVFIDAEIPPESAASGIAQAARDALPALCIPSIQFLYILPNFLQ